MEDVLRRRILVEAARLASEVVDFFEALERDPPAVLDRAFPVEDPALRAPAGDGADTGRGATREASVPVSPVTGAPIDGDKPFDAGRRGLEKIMQEGLEAALADDEALDLQTIVLVAVRPAILIQGGRFLPPAPPWELLESSRDFIEAVARSVGRIQLSPASEAKPFAGTGFFVSPDLIMTNLHVAKSFGDVVDGTFRFEPALTSAVDLARNPDAESGPEFAVRSVVTHPTLDLALLKVDSGGVPMAPPLTVSASPPSPPEPGEPQWVYAVGYPGNDPLHGEDLLEQVLGGVFGVKRLQPGQIMRILDDKPVFNHDCSTLRGNSGSCVVDLATHQVIGLHFSGKLFKFNEAVALWKLTDDPLLQGVNFR